MIYKNLNPQKALIWRITHRNNIPWILDNGLHCSSSKIKDPNYVSIGNSDLIDRRKFREVPIRPGGTLADYVPFYFTPFSVMLKNIHSGWGVARRDNEEIVILVSSLFRARDVGASVLFTNAHAYPSWSCYYNDFSDLSNIDWDLLQRRDFKRDADDPRKMERYQAEALVHKELPISGLLGIVVYDPGQERITSSHMQDRSIDIPIYVRPDWYFR